jgi:uncharacterized protein YjbI with pentapeptide repeats
MTVEFDATKPPYKQPKRRQEAAELREVSPEKLKDILEEHEKWVESEGIEGNEANFNLYNMQEADLSVANLQEANLTNANLHRARLFGANLQNADLRTANLQKASLKNANLQKANLSYSRAEEIFFETHTKLQEADLSGTKLLGANLRGVNLTLANHLTQPQLNQACVDENTILPEGLTRPEPCSEEELSPN